ncbi:MAG: hypothetical protein SPI77_04975 [Corynebacterium sp.]|nr:hypothetical protein [Corynebacterium sp.]
MAEFTHLAHIDAVVWPDVVTVPLDGLFPARRARSAEQQFARACAQAELPLGMDGALTVHHDAVFYRIAARGWLGLAEGFMAGEWTAPDLASVLSGLLGAVYRPQRNPSVRAEVLAEPAGIPRRLCELTSPTSSLMVGMFAGGVSTTVGPRTVVTAPGEVTRTDVADSQERAADTLLDGAAVRSSDSVVELTLGAPLLASQATARGARVDVVSPDPAVIGWINTMDLPGITVRRIPSPVPDGGLYPRRISALVGADYMAMLSANQRAALFRFADMELAPVGRMAFQEFTRTDSPLIDHALTASRHYLLPSFNPVTGEEAMAKLAGGTTRIALAHSTQFAGHIVPTLAVMRDQFLGVQTLAGAEGFDPVYRRLWLWHLSTLMALAKQRLLGISQFVFRPLAAPR